MDLDVKTVPVAPAITVKSVAFPAFCSQTYEYGAVPPVVPDKLSASCTSPEQTVVTLLKTLIDPASSDCATPANDIANALKKAQS